ncbi:MAG: alpha/beta hydrolase-fold protein [Mucilaginibacter sp.]|uniref:alpha/beta hydrolase n=1 Tax=Mucilaginibacter sp. TaxID=1882438 RepID=UPI0031A1A06A
MTLINYHLRKLVLCLISLLLASYAIAQKKDQGNTSTIDKYPEARIPNSAVIDMYSKLTGDTLRISILFPQGYNADSTKNYPVIYLTDANFSFASLTQILQVLQMGQDSQNGQNSKGVLPVKRRDLLLGVLQKSNDVQPYIPDAFVVGIGYKSTMQWAVQRYWDLTPVEDPSIPTKTGGASYFLQFINEELKPMIKNRFHASGPATYVGLSLGGLFGLYALFNQPQSFQNYIIGSPSLYYGNRVIFKYFDEFKAKHNDLNARVFMSVGSLEQPNTTADTFHMIDNWKILSNKLLDLHFTNLHLNSIMFPNETHLSVGSIAYSTGLRFIFQQID